MTASHSNPNRPGDPLDDCLKHARWPEPTGLQRNRLEAQWDRLAAQRLRARQRVFRWVIAASMFLAVGLGFAGWTIWNADEPQVTLPGPNVSPPRMARKRALPEEDNPPPEPLARSATRYEKLAFEMAVRHRRQARVNREPQKLVDALRQLIEHPDAGVPKLCGPLEPERAAYETLLLTHLGSLNPAQQQAALKILAEIGSPRAIPVLDRLSRDPEFEKSAWPVALRLAPAGLLGSWARRVPAPRREDVLKMLIRRPEDPQTLPVFLHLIAQPALRESALRVIEQDPDPPVEDLFAFLKRGTKEQRHTAGLVLGKIATPEITTQLLALARDENLPPEVMTALLHSPDKDAARFVKLAQQNPQTRPAVQLAYVEWQWISYTSNFPLPVEIP